MAITLQVQSLNDLGAVFEVLSAGTSVVLRPPSTHESLVEESPPRPDAVWLGLFSSGSTGSPKLVWWPWEELAASPRAAARTTGWTWASSFRPESYAGIQVALQAWRSSGKIVPLPKDWVESWSLIRQHRPEALSCTPTFLDLLLQFEGDRVGWSPQQVTLGGEVLRPRAGERFAARFPATRFTVIYASAEYGVLLRTHRLDGWYETDALAQRGEWQVRGGILELRRGGNWLSTGDRVELEPGLIRIEGRSDAVANVGGVKVSLPEIERLAEEVPGVRRAIAFAEANDVVGQIVGLQFALEDGVQEQDVQTRLEGHLRASLRKEAWPRRWEAGQVGLGANSKRVRASNRPLAASQE